MAKNILVIDNKLRNSKQWDILHNFEHKEKELFLKKLTVDKALKMFQYFYEFGQEINGSAYYGKLDPMKVEALSKVHFMFMKVDRMLPSSFRNKIRRVSRG